MAFPSVLLFLLFFLVLNSSCSCSCSSSVLPCCMPDRARGPTMSSSSAAAASTSVVEDCGLLAVDCVVVCCCCPCLLLQITVFLFVRLPHRIARRSKRIVLKQLQKRLKKGAYGLKDVKKKKMRQVAAGGGCELIERHCWIAAGGGSFGEAERALLQELMGGGRRSCFEEAEEVLKLELALDQELLWFGSFWGTRIG